ncbi:MAG: hypothetical protein QM621_03700 [Aeromicrobium sp.]|uniref:hypothetical protein n=1 Tax=Aeromicrobium sp. TaxID=1871063 RepID=UPI0039E27A5E
MNRSRSRAARLVVIAALGVLLTACGGGEPTPHPSVPAGFDVPEGVEITKAGAKLTAGESATVVYQIDEKATTAITVTINDVRKGPIEDFQFFSLTPEQSASTPFYVDLTVVNEGPAGMGGAALPVFARDDKKTLLPPTPVVGGFEPCPKGQLPESFLPDEKASLCLVYLVPQGRALVSVDVEPDGPKSTITWTP